MLRTRWSHDLGIFVWLFIQTSICIAQQQITVDFSTPPAASPSQNSKIITVEDVIKLSKAGISDDVIVSQIKKRSQPFDLSTDQLLQLKAAHVSDAVIAAMTGTSSAPPPAARPPISTAPPAAATDHAGVPNNPEKSALVREMQSLPDGFYYRSPQGWKQLAPISMAGGGLKHVGKMFVPGLTPQMVWTFRGAEAPVQIAEQRPTFCIKEMPALAGMAGRSARDVVIVRFDKKTDRRELQTTNGGNMFTFKAGLSKDRTPEIATKTIGDGVFIVTLNEDLKAGEYLITFSALGTSGYDFGVKR